MILFFNVKITNQGLSHYARANYLPGADRLSIFKYCLASYSALVPVLSKCIFYIQLEPMFANRRDELDQWIRELFPADKLELHWHRNNTTREFRNVCEQFEDDDLIWFAGNDDHIFIDYDLDVVRAGINILRADPNPLSVIYYSHWPEQMRLCMEYNGQLTEDRNYIKFDWRTFDAIRILKGRRFKQYWRDNEFGETLIYRTDHLFHSGYQLTGPVYAPTRELVRHYDGYSHISPVNPQAIANTAPPLFIPPGFFEGTMKIRIGYGNRDPRWTNLNPQSANLYANTPDGTDYRWVEADIPLFWRDRIEQIDIAPDYDVDEMNKSRDSAFLNISRVPMTCYNINFTDEKTSPLDWFSNHLRYNV